MAFEGQALLADVFALVREAVDSDRVHPFVRRSEVELQHHALRRDQVRRVATVGLPSRLLLVDGVPAGRRGIHRVKCRHGARGYLSAKTAPPTSGSSSTVDSATAGGSTGCRMDIAGRAWTATSCQQGKGYVCCLTSVRRSDGPTSVSVEGAPSSPAASVSAQSAFSFLHWSCWKLTWSGSLSARRDRLGGSGFGCACRFSRIKHVPRDAGRASIRKKRTWAKGPEPSADRAQQSLPPRWRVRCRRCLVGTSPSPHRAFG